MHFRCPNCQQPIQFGDATIVGDEDAIECPSCHSRFSLTERNDTTAAIPAGERIAHFELISVIGEGGFGVVYKAWDTELDRYVALKVPRPGRITQETTARFLKEARAAAGIDHPHVVTVFEVGLHEEQPYIASQLIDGVSLSDYRRIHDLRPEEIAQLMFKILRGVDAFHQKELLHRDLKPSNILIDDQGDPHITDFGLVKDLKAEGVTLTMEGRLIGTLHYMSPEQAAGQISETSERSDIFSCGVILYELLAGTRPFQATSSQTLIHRIQHEDPSSLRQLNAAVPKDLETICLKALRREAPQRYTNASEFAEDLENFLEHRPISARRIHPVQRLVRWYRRDRARAGFVTTGVVACTCLVIIFLLWLRPSAGVPVVLTTQPPADRIQYTQYDSALRVPHPSGFRVVGEHGSATRLLPGLYKVVASTDEGRHHEVWRTVPEEGVDVSGMSLFPQFDFDRDDEGNVVLPEVRLFFDHEVDEPLVLIPEGNFEMGTEAPGGVAGKHTQNVATFFVGVNEVTWEKFRDIMATPYHRDSSRSYADVLDQAYGDRSDANDREPVTGYPPDVANLYAELAGGRLPTNVEYEYVATGRGRFPFPTGDQPAVPADQPWSVLSIDNPTSDASPAGIRGLYSNVAEFTDSSTIAYIRQYPERFADRADANQRQTSTLPDDLRALLARQREIRGAPPTWVVTGMADSTRDVRLRVSLPPVPVKTKKASEFYGRIGWRLYRSQAP